MKNEQRIKEEIQLTKNIVEKCRNQIETYGWNFLSEDLKQYYTEKCTILRILEWILEN